MIIEIKKNIKQEGGLGRAGVAMIAQWPKKTSLKNRDLKEVKKLPHGRLGEKHSWESKLQRFRGGTELEVWRFTGNPVCWEIMSRRGKSRNGSQRGSEEPRGLREKQDHWS